MRVNQGKVIAIRGSIVDVLFPDSLPVPHSLLEAGINKRVALEIMAYLSSEENSKAGAIDIQLAAYIQTEKMAEQGIEPFKLSQSSFKHSYWTISQMVTHHTVNGCNLQPGDLLGSGTQSGPAEEEAGSLLELSGAGKRPISLPSGESRTFLEDGDTIILKGFCETEGAARIGLGEAIGKVIK